MGMYGGNRLTRGVVGGGGPAPVTPDEEFQAKFYDNSITPSIGPTLTYLSPSTAYYTTGTNETSDLVTVSGSTPALGAYAPYIDTERSGIALFRASTNDLLQSEAPATTWVQVGPPTSVTNDVGTWGALSYGSIVASGAGQGIQQASATTAASRVCTAAVWLATDAGTLDVTLTLEGSTGATPNTATRVVRVTTLPRRYFFNHTFAAGTTGNLQFKITLEAAGTLYLAGMQLDPTLSPIGLPPYVKTTVAAASRQPDRLSFTSSTIYTPDEGSVSFWMCPTLLGSFRAGNGSNAIMYSMMRERASGGGNLVLGLAVPDQRGALQSYVGALQAPTMTRSERFVRGSSPSRWMHIAYSWKTTMYPGFANVATATGLGIWQICVNGRVVGDWQVGNNLTDLGRHVSELVSLAGFPINGVLNTTSTIHPNSILADVRMYPDFKQHEYWKAQYNAEVQYYTNRTPRYGFPTDNRYEHGVAAQWIFDEASGDIVDEVAGMTLTATGGDLTYEVDTTAYSSAMPKGISQSGTSYFTKAGAEASLNIGTGGAAFEWVASFGTSNGAVFDFRNDSATPTSGFSFSINTATSTLTWQLVATDATTVTRSAALLPAKVVNGDYCKHAFIVDRVNNFAVYMVDGIIIDALSITTLNGKSLNCENVFLMKNATTAGSVTGTMLEFRASIGADYNDSGGPLGTI
jgi:hypothetical protein